MVSIVLAHIAMAQGTKLAFIATVPAKKKYKSSMFNVGAATYFVVVPFNLFFLTKNNLQGILLHRAVFRKRGSDAYQYTAKN